MEYLPSLRWVKEKGFIPNINPPKNWRTGIKKFYLNGGKEKIEQDAKNFSDSLETIMGKPEIELRWDNKEGLNGISLGTQPAIYFEENTWIEHNLGTKYSLIATGIILNYYKELSKYILE